MHQTADTSFPARRGLGKATLASGFIFPKNSVT